ncbi:MAG: hypothetical protein ACRDTE_03175 [Pseudonocardiaceae bacterium]
MSWHPACGSVLVSCHVYPDGPPILSVSDGAGFSLSISSGRRSVVSVEHAVFARRFAEQAGVYALECERWAVRSAGAPEREEPPQSAA